ncbi:MAG: helix-turn-helix domain-containing protein [Pseudobacteriovorax sp.]|nr:helix-turn-helix domain-containing protein [Pseudobacteriovorax sp.]
MAQIGYKYKLRLNWRTKDRLNQWIGANRLLWNLALSQREMIEHKEFKFRETIAGNFSSVNYNYQEKQLKALKNEYPFFKDLPSQSLQQCLMQLDRAFRRFFKKQADFPKPKKKGKKTKRSRYQISHSKRRSH